MGRVETRTKRGSSARRPGSARRVSKAESAAGALDGQIGHDFLLLGMFGLAAFVALAVYGPELMRPAGPAIHGWLQGWLGAGALFIPPAIAVLPGVLLANRLQMRFRRALAALLAAGLYVSLCAGLVSGTGWGGMLGEACAAAGDDYLGAFYPVLLLLLGLAVAVRIAGRALLIPAAKLVGHGAAQTGRQVVQAGATLAPAVVGAGAAVVSAGAALRQSAGSAAARIAERRAAVLAAELEAADSPDGDSPLVYEVIHPSIPATGALTTTEASAAAEAPTVKRRGRLRPVTMHVPPDGLADADDAAFAAALVLGDGPGRDEALPRPRGDEAAVQPPDPAGSAAVLETGAGRAGHGLAPTSGQYDHVLHADEAELGAGQLGLFGSTQAGYQLPPLSLLRDAPKRSGEDEHLEKRAAIIERTLRSFNVDATCVNAVVGPRVTRYELKIGPGINVSKIHNLADNLALELAVKAVRIEAPVPGLSAVGIEAPNAAPDLVTLKNILESGANQRSNHPLTVGLGRDIAGQAIVANLAKMPHLLVAGATGSGKSVCLNALIVSLLMRNAPDTLRLILIDPKRVEMTSYSDVPHLACSVVHDVHQAQSALKWAVAEMERRYRLLEARRARNIAAFNAQAQPGEALPFIVIVVDELADLMMLAGQAVEKLICRIAQLSRAVGIHLVIATQRPDVKVITGTIKANIPSRIAFAVVSQIDSRTILDGGGAEKLLGSGDMLFSPIGETAPMRIQGCYLSDEEIEKVVEHCRAQGAAHYDDEVLSYGDSGGGDPGGEGDWIDASLAGGGLAARRARDERDEYFDPALEIIRETGRASTSYLQRRLKIGYNRAARVMDELEAAGFVSAPDSRGDRKVL